MVLITTYENSLKTAGENKYCFRSVTDRTIDSEQLIKEIINYNSTITEADVRAVLSVLNDRVKHFVNEGASVELPFGYVFLRANGTVAKLNDGFMPGKGDHELNACFKFKKESKAEMEKSGFYRIDSTGWKILPKINELVSLTDGGKESGTLIFQAYDILRIKGENLSFDPDDEKQGVFLYGTETASKTRLNRYHNVGTNVTDVFIPQGINSGTYQVNIVTKPRLDGMEEYTFSKIITAA